MFQAVILAVLALFLVESDANPDAKRLYDDLLADYNRLIRPVSNHTDKVTVKLGLRLSQLVDLVRRFVSPLFSSGSLLTLDQKISFNHFAIF